MTADTSSYFDPRVNDAVEMLEQLLQRSATQYDAKRLPTCIAGAIWTDHMIFGFLSWSRDCANGFFAIVISVIHCR